MHRSFFAARVVPVVMLVVTGAFADQPVFPPPPRLATTVADLAALKASPTFPKIKAEATRIGDALLKNPPIVPDGAGDWSFYYACPDDASDLKALSLKEHQCPRCKKIFTDERTVASYRTILHDRANAAAIDLAEAFAYTDNVAYAEGAQGVLLKIADDYAGYPKRRDRWGRTGFFAQLGGRRYAQSLDEAYGVIRLAKAYDLSRTASCWTDPQRQHVEKDLFRAVADTLLYVNLDINNHQTWFDAGLISIASVLGDADLVNKVLTMRGGYYDQLKRSIDNDGLWYEGTMAYQRYALQAMIEVVDAGRKLGLPLHEEPRFRNFTMGPLRCAYPNGDFPAINDSDRMNIKSFNGYFEWAARAYKDWPGDPIPKAETKSYNFGEAGLAVLRRGEGEKAVCAMIDYGPHGGGHGHFDKLNLLLFANGREWLLDPGRLSYSHKEYKTWVKHTAAHNTVTLGGESQSATTGKLLWFEVKDNFVSCATQSNDAYPGALLTRYVVLSDDLLVDWFDVSSEKGTQIDLLVHAVSKSVSPVPERGASAAATPGTRDGYPHLTDAVGWDVSGSSRWEFVASDALKLGVTFAGEKQEKILSTIGIGHTISQKVPCLIRRVTGSKATFVSVYDLNGKAEFVKSIAADGAARSVAVDTTAGRRTFCFGDSGVSENTE